MAEPIPPTPVTIPAQLRLGDRSLPVPTLPLCMHPRKRRDVEFIVPEPDVLALVPTFRSLLGLAIALGLLMLMLVGAIGFLWVVAIMTYSEIGAGFSLFLVLMSFPLL